MSDFVNTRTTMGDQATLDALIANTLTTLREDGVRSLGARSLYKNIGLTLVELPSVTSAGDYSLSGCTGLASATFAALTSVGQYMFDGDTALTSVSLPEATNIGNYAFRGAPIAKLALPKATTLGTYINNGYGAAEVDLTAGPSSIANNTFNGAYNMTSLVLRKSTMISLASTGAFTSTPIASGFGWIYVPNDLVDTYKAATNWSTYASQIVSINSYPLEIGSITDTWAQIFAAEDDGTYSSKYNVGDTKFVKINGIPVCMQIAAIDGDELADGTGNAKITWLCKGYQGSHNMNATNITTGGWEDSAMRQYLINNILPGIESTVANRIKTVHKTYYDVGTSSTKTSADAIWIPSYREVGFGTNKESSGVIYSGLFTDATSRIKYITCTSTSAAYWWLRSAYGGSTFYYVSGGGASGNGGASGSYGVVFGFCT